MDLPIKNIYRILTNEAARQQEVPVIMPDNINLIPRTHVLDGEKQLLQFVL